VVILSNTNQLLGNPGILGGKTGTTDEAGACLVTAVQTEDGERVVVVVLGCEQEIDTEDRLVADHRYDDTLALIDATVQPAPLPASPPLATVEHVPA
jgi:D-alanyl-D-alanine carboxypeptidase